MGLTWQLGQAGAHPPGSPGHRHRSQALNQERMELLWPGPGEADMACLGGSHKLVTRMAGHGERGQGLPGGGSHSGEP